MSKSPIAVTLGDPSGIGPEITVKAKKIIKGDIPFFVLGDYSFLTELSSKYCLETKLISSPNETLQNLEKLCVINNKFPQRVYPGQVELNNQRSVISAIEQAVCFVKNGSASALVTNPINKWALKHGAGFSFSGHTDFLKYLDTLCENDPVMMLANESGLRVVPTTVHIPLNQVASELNVDLLTRTIKTVDQSLKQDFSIEAPKILVTGLNPHAGENSSLGFEEEKIIKPVVKKMIDFGLIINGPVPADSAFKRENRDYYDAFVCMYHDQALIPIKTLEFHNSTNITLGLTFVRTSPDHGTAFDIAGKNIAKPDALILAIKQANKIAEVRKNAI